MDGERCAAGHRCFQHGLGNSVRWRFLEWAQLNLRSLKATHVPGRLNCGADMLSRSNVPSGEWTPTDGQGHVGPQLAQPPLLRFFPDILDPSSNQLNQGTEAQASSVGPSLEKPTSVLGAVPAACSSPPWPIPLRQDLLSQVNGTILHPQPKLWALHLWSLDRSL
ncbi:ATP synthase subunit alpha [Labeo rohita]|uniref:ATP synthase subunit alpha n=1 Tax=Labeo rohita TaxID=84645 RepID=A0ABQ8KYZ2_LABRO|nr:ATP synthase subunit alpha [Labeo rohita]